MGPSSPQRQNLRRRGRRRFQDSPLPRRWHVSHVSFTCMHTQSLGSHGSAFGSHDEETKIIGWVWKVVEGFQTGLEYYHRCFDGDRHSVVLEGQRHAS